MELPGLHFLFQEARALLERGLAVGGKVDDKAANLVTFNAVVLGLLVTGATVSHPAHAAWWVILALSTGPALLLASMLCAIRAYRPAEYSVGIQGADLDAAASQRFAEAALYRAGLQAYRAASEQNAFHLHGKVAWVRRSLRLLALGLAASMLSIVFIIPLLGWRSP